MRIPRAGRVDMTARDNQSKLIHAGDQYLGSDYPYLLVQDDSIRMVGALDRGISIDPEFGTLIQGPISFAEAPENISFCGYWRLNPMVLCSIGSSAAMPVPMLVPGQPRLLAPKKGLGSLVQGIGI